MTNNVGTHLLWVSSHLQGIYDEAFPERTLDGTSPFQDNGQTLPERYNTQLDEIADKVEWLKKHLQ